MTDIVERLRVEADLYEQCGDTKITRHYRAAATEIERLREALREISDLPNLMEDAKPSDYARGFVNGRYRAQDIARAILAKHKEKA